MTESQDLRPTLYKHHVTFIKVFDSRQLLITIVLESKFTNAYHRVSSCHSITKT